MLVRSISWTWNVTWVMRKIWAASSDNQNLHFDGWMTSLRKTLDSFAWYRAWYNLEIKSNATFKNSKVTHNATYSTGTITFKNSFNCCLKVTHTATYRDYNMFDYHIFDAESALTFPYLPSQSLLKIMMQNFYFFMSLLS